MFHRDRTNREGGGVLLYVKESLNVGGYNISPNHELIAVDLKVDTVFYRVLLLYRAPHQLIDEDRELYREIGALMEGRVCLLMGDFNSHVNWETRESTVASSPLLEFVNKSFLTQWVR